MGRSVASVATKHSINSDNNKVALQYISSVLGESC